MNINKKALLFSIIFVSLPLWFLTNMVLADSKSVPNNSIYCWYDHGIPAESLEKAIDQCHYLNITDVYTTFTSFDDQVEMISTLKANGISTYYLTGRSNWYNNVDIIKEKIDKVAKYNSSHPEASITGIVLDIEPYTLKEYKADVITGFSIYADTIENAYTYAKSKNIKFVNTIPYWYDNYITKDDYTNKEHETAQAAFDKIFKNADRISVMNYLKRNMNEHIKNEIIYARLYNIEIESAADFSKPSDSSANDETSFYSEINPISSINSFWKDMVKTYHYDKLNFSYHHMQMLLEMDIFKEEKPDYSTPDNWMSETTISPGYGYVINRGKNQYMIINSKEAAFVGTSDITAAKLTIPDKIVFKDNFIKVRSINAGALKDMPITELYIGKGVKIIEESAFENCRKLRNIKLGNKLVFIGKNAFKNCSSLKKIVIPSTVTTIKDGAFYGNKKLKSITITGKKLNHIGTDAFKNINKKVCFKLKGSKKERKIIFKRIIKTRIGYRKTWKIRR